jgi:hypothetical protein
VVAAVEILPDRLQVQPNTPFQLRFRVWDAAGHVVPPPEGVSPTWAAAAPVALLNSAGDAATLTVTATSGGPWTVTLKLGSLTDDVPVSLPATAAGASADELLAPVPGTTKAMETGATLQPVPATPAFALVSGFRGGTPVHHEPLSFVGKAVFDNLTSGPGAVTALLPQYAAVVRTAPWTAAPELVDYAGANLPALVRATPIAPLPVAVRVFDATAAQDVTTWHLELAARIFEDNHTGIALAEDDGSVTRLSPQVVAVPEACDAPEARFPDAGFDPRSGLHVFYVQGIWFSGTRQLGWACEPSGQPGRAARVIFVRHDAHTTTLAHELGHVLSLRQPYFGHVNCVGGFDKANVMWSFPDEGHAQSREFLSLGQAFRVVADDSSYINMAGMRAATEPRYRCRNQDRADPNQTAGACPSLPHPRTPPPGWERPDDWICGPW